MLSHHPNLRYNIVDELKKKSWNTGFVNDNPYIKLYGYLLIKLYK
jgi:hypothetical protein